MSDLPPALPNHVSSDAREIWDWAEALGQWSARQHRKGVLAAEIKRLSSNRCGNCNDWMKSKICPRERNVGGMTRGPSCEDYGCKQFARKSWVEDLLTKKQAELLALQEQTA